MSSPAVDSLINGIVSYYGNYPSKEHIMSDLILESSNLNGFTNNLSCRNNTIRFNRQNIKSQLLHRYNNNLNFTFDGHINLHFK